MTGAAVRFVEKEKEIKARYSEKKRALLGRQRQSKSDDAFQGVNDLSELAAVLDFYEVRSRTEATCKCYLCADTLAAERVTTVSQIYLQLSGLSGRCVLNSAHALFPPLQYWAFDASLRWHGDAGRRRLRRNWGESIP